jgi:hypothetical protein
VAFVAEQIIGYGLTNLLLHGRRWIAWGIAFFVVGLFVSLAKGGQVRRLRRALMRLHLALQGSNRNS